MYKLLLFLIFFGYINVNAQKDLLEEIDTQEVTGPEPPSFKALQIVTAQSTKLAEKGDIYFVVSHRFGDVSEGLKNFFGLDNATTKIGGIYGLTDAISLSAARHTYQKTYELGAKYRLLQQNNSKNIPFTVVGYNSLGINSQLDKDDFAGLEFKDRLTYTSQILVSRRFSEDFSLQLMPSYVHRNLINPALETDANFLGGIGGRYKLSKRISLNAEYFYNFSSNGYYQNPLSLGIDIETGGHVFQLLFTNSQPNSDAGYLMNGTGNWGKGEVFFGFNLYRVF